MALFVSDKQVVDDSASVAKWTLLSRITGFVRVLLIAAVLGPSYFGNLFQIANQLPWILFELTVGVLLGAILIPRLVPHVDRGDLAAVSRISSGTLGVVFVVFGAVAGLVMLAAPIVGAVFGQRVDPDVQADFIRASLPLILLTAPQLVGYGIAATGQAVQQALGEFSLPAAASILENLAVIVTMIVYAGVFGTGTALADVGIGHLLLLGGGSSAGVALHATLQWWGVRRLGVRLVPSAGWRDPEVRSMVRTAIPSSGTALLNGGRFLVLMLAANSVAGGVVALQLALNVFSLPVALGAKPVAYAVLPRLSSLWAARNEADFGNEYGKSLGLAGLVAVPAAAAVAGLGWFGAPVIAFGEMNTPFGRELIALAVVGVAGAILGETLHQLGVAGSYARHDAISPLRAYALRLGLLVVGAAIAVAFSEGTALLLVLTLALSVSDIVSGVYLHRRVTSPLPARSYGLSTSISNTAKATLFSFGVAAAIAGLAAPITDSRIPRLTAGIALGGAACVGYAVLRLRPDDEFADFLSGFRRKEQDLAL